MLIRKALDLSGLPAGPARRVRRVALGLTATEAARRVGCDLDDLWSVETGRARWPHELAAGERLAALYDRLEAQRAAGAAEAPGAA